MRLEKRETRLLKMINANQEDKNTFNNARV